MHNIVVIQDKFDIDGDNKPEHMVIFREYTDLIENTINSMMCARVPVS